MLWDEWRPGKIQNKIEEALSVEEKALDAYRVENATDQRVKVIVDDEKERIEFVRSVIQKPFASGPIGCLAVLFVATIIFVSMTTVQILANQYLSRISISYYLSSCIAFPILVWRSIF
ncbi:unnamed protein product [Gemmata massiliana]|uniref:Uncharacterized protein n=1 Tax=Gemmata massiliana TaxID=1210884 RepID=A0A6P2CPR6_9BACT|nr:hypothetical protein [Gemmata massiliana]VTR90941.1 unnamed protein product [Gemmata massiliana]